MTITDKTDGIEITTNGGEIVAGATNTQYSVTDGTGLIVDNWTDPNNPIAYEVSWTGKTNITPTNLATSTVTFVFMDKNGNIVETTTAPTEPTRRDYIFLGQLGHANKSTINAYVATPDVLASPISQLRDLFGDIGNINEGNVITANGANLSIDKSNGYLTGLGVGYFTDIKSPNKKNFPAQVLATIRRRTQTGGTGTSTTLDPLNYDVAGTVTAISGTKVQNQRVYLLPSGNIVVQYGQVLYNSLSEAIQGLSSESFVQLENTKQGTLICVISIQSNCVSLQNTTRSRILNLGKFGELSSGTSGTSVSTLQQSYSNSTNPEITTDSTRGSVTFKRGSVADTDDVIEVLNGAGTKTFSVTGNGVITGDGSGITGISVSSSFCSVPIGTTDGTQTSANTVYAVKVVAPSSGTFTTLETYLNFGSGSETITLGVYNSAGTTLISSGSGLGATGVFSVTGLSIPLVAGTQYIFAIKADLGTSDFLKTTCFINSFVASSVFAGAAGLPASIAGASASNVAPYICIK